jgi:hypothetical protein
MARNARNYPVEIIAPVKVKKIDVYQKFLLFMPECK